MTTYFIFLFGISQMVNYPLPHEFNNPIPYDSSIAKYTYTDILTKEELNASQLYLIVKNWLIQEDLDGKFKVNNENKQLVTQRYFTIHFVQKSGKIPIQQHIIYDAIFDFKDGRCRYKFTNFKISSSSSGTTEDWTLEYYVNTDQSIPGMGGAMVRKNIQKNIESSCHEIHKEVTKIIDDLKLAISKELIHDDW